MPSYEYLFSSGEQFALRMRLLDHIFDDMIVEDFRLNIILPEGAVVSKQNKNSFLEAVFLANALSDFLG